MKFLRLALLTAAVAPTAVRAATPGTAPAADTAPGESPGEALARENRQLAAELARAQTAVRDAQTALTKQSAEVATVRAEAAATRIQLTKAQAEVAAARNSLASQGAAAQVTPNLSGALERERTSHLATKAILAQRESQVQDLISSRTKFESENRVLKAATEAAKSTPAEASTKTLAQNAELNAKVAALNRDLQNGRSEISTLRQELRNQVNKATTDADAHARQVAALQESHTQARTELSQAKASLDTTAQSAAAAAAARAEAESQLAVLRTQLTGLERDLQAATANVRRFTAAQARFESVQQEAIETRQQLAAVTKELQTLREKPGNSPGDLTVARLELAQARTALAAVTTQSAALKFESEAQLAKLQGEVTQLQREAQNSTRASAAEITQLREALAKAETPKMSAADVAAIRIQERQLAALEEELAAARSQLGQTKAALDAAAQSAAASTAAKTEAETQITQLRGATAALQRDLAAANAAARQQTAAYEAESARLQGILARSSQAASVPAVELETAQRNAAETQRRLSAAREEIESLRSQVAAYQNLEQRVRQLEAEKVALDTRPREPAHQNELDRATAARAAAEDKLATALRSYALLVQERDELRRQVGTLSVKETAKTEPTTFAASTPEPIKFAVAPVPPPQPVTFAEVPVTPPEPAPLPASSPTPAPRPAPRPAAKPTASARTVGAYTFSPVSPTRPVAPTTRPVVQPGQPALSHRIAAGETLSSIAKLYYGSPARWPEIVAANRDILTNQRSFTAGRMIRIP